MIAMQTDVDRERAALKVSLGATAALAALAIAWGLVAGSQVILLDGAYAIVGMALTVVSLLASRVAASPPSTHYPYGREALVPLAIALQGFALFATLAYAALEAVRVILAGGSQVAAGSLIAYGAASGAACVVLWRYMARADPNSDLLAAEARQWAAAAVFSLVVVLGAALTLGLRGLGLTGWEPYIDSVLVLVGCVLLVSQPAALIRTALNELLEGAPSTSVQREVHDALVRVGQSHGLPDPLIRMNKVGRKLYIDVVYLVEPGCWTVDQQDAVWRDATAALAGRPHDSWLSVELTTDQEHLT